MGEIQETYALAEICGAIIGDGWIQSNEKGFFLTGDPTEDKDYYDSHISKEITRLIYPVKPKNFPYWKVYGVSIYKKKIISRLLDLGLPKGMKVNAAKVPSWILDNNDSQVRNSFIRGFFDTDGGIFCQKDYSKYAKDFDRRYHSKIRLRMSNTSGKLMKQIFAMLHKENFNPILRIRKGGRRNNRNNNDIHIIEINSKNKIIKFFKEIGTSNLRHKTRFDIWKRFGFCPPRTTIFQRKDILKNNLDPYDLYKRE